MSYNFKMLNSKVLQFDDIKDINKIRFNHYIMRKENKNRLTKELPPGQFKMTIKTAMEDLNLSKNIVERLIKVFEKLVIIKCINKGNLAKGYSIYEYISLRTMKDYMTEVDTGYETGDTNKTTSYKSSNSNGCSYMYEDKYISKNGTVSGTVNKKGHKNSKINNKNIYLNKNILSSEFEEKGYWDIEFDF